MSNPDTNPSFRLGEARVLRTGALIDDRYEITQYLGCGGMGSVYRARHVEMDRVVAIKLLHPRFCADAAAVMRFQREAKIISRFQHPHLLAIYGFGGMEGVIYLAMEFVQGTSLGELIHLNGAMPLKQAIPLFLQICNAMSYAHKSGVLHRDLKPDNVMILESPSREMQAKVVDFGLAKLSGEAQRLTRTGEVVGDPRYMSPEQCYGKPLDERSDIYSFGCLMFEVLTGVQPHQADDPVAMMHKQITDEVAPFAKRLGLPQSIESITLVAMAKDKNQRFASFDEIIEALNRFSADPEVLIDRAVPQGKRNAIIGTPLVLVVSVALIAVLATAALVFLKPADGQVVQARFNYYFSQSPLERTRAALVIASHAETIHEDDQAVALYMEAAKLANDAGKSTYGIQAYASVGKIHARNNKTGEATEAFANCVSIALSQLRDGAFDERYFPAVLNAMQEYSSLEPTQAIKTAHELSSELIRLKRTDKARIILETIAARGENVSRANTLRMIGQLYLAEGNKAKAEEYFDRSIDITGSGTNRVALLQAAGSEFIKKGEPATALKYYRASLDESRKHKVPVGETIYRQIADCYLKVGQFESASTFYRKALSLTKAETILNVGQLIATLDQFGLSEFQQGNYAEAEKAFKEETELLKRQPNPDVQQRAWAHCKLANTLLREGRGLAADGEFQAALTVIEKSANPAAFSSLKETINTYRRQ